MQISRDSIKLVLLLQQPLQNSHESSHLRPATVELGSWENGPFMPYASGENSAKLYTSPARATPRTVWRSQVGNLAVR